MRVTIAGTTFVVNWRYGTVALETPSPSFRPNTQIETTCRVARVLEDNTLETLEVGTALCSVLDNFEKEKGRKISMTRALQNFDKSYRKLFWNAYFSRFAGLPKNTSAIL